MTARVGVVGAAGRMGRLVAETVAAADDLEVAGAVDPAGGEVAGVAVVGSVSELGDLDVVIDFTRPEVVLDNLASYRMMGVDAVIGTSGFDEARIAAVEEMWAGADRRCLIVPNFSIGAVLMMRFAQMAASHFSASEVIELHHDAKVDAPSGTAIATARRMGGGPQERRVESSEAVPGVRGGRVGEVAVHSVRLPGLLAHQEAIFGSPGEVLTIRHDSTDRVSFMPGVLLAVRSVGSLERPVTVGLEGLLGL